MIKGLPDLLLLPPARHMLQRRLVLPVAQRSWFHCFLVPHICSVLWFSPVTWFSRDWPSKAALLWGIALSGYCVLGWGICSFPSFQGLEIGTYSNWLEPSSCRLTLHWCVSVTGRLRPSGTDTQEKVLLGQAVTRAIYGWASPWTNCQRSWNSQVQALWLIHSSLGHQTQLRESFRLLAYWRNAIQVTHFWPWHYTSFFIGSKWRNPDNFLTDLPSQQCNDFNEISCKRQEEPSGKGEKG